MCVARFACSAIMRCLNKVSTLEKVCDIVYSYIDCVYSLSVNLNSKAIFTVANLT